MDAMYESENYIKQLAELIDSIPKDSFYEKIELVLPDVNAFKANIDSYYNIIDRILIKLSEIKKLYEEEKSEDNIKRISEYIDFLESAKHFKENNENYILPFELNEKHKVFFTERSYDEIQKIAEQDNAVIKKLIRFLSTYNTDGILPKRTQPLEQLKNEISRFKLDQHYRIMYYKHNDGIIIVGAFKRTNSTQDYFAYKNELSNIDKYSKQFDDLENNVLDIENAHFKTLNYLRQKYFKFTNEEKETIINKENLLNEEIKEDNQAVRENTSNVEMLEENKPLEKTTTQLEPKEKKQKKEDKQLKGEVKQIKENVIQFSNSKTSDKWRTTYKLVKDFRKEYGHLLIMVGHMSNGKDLGAWIANQRHAYRNCKLNQEQFDLLCAINMFWETANKKSINDYLNKKGIEKRTLVNGKEVDIPLNKNNLRIKESQSDSNLAKQNELYDNNDDLFQNKPKTGNFELAIKQIKEEINILQKEVNLKKEYIKQIKDLIEVYDQLKEDEMFLETQLKEIDESTNNYPKTI